MLDEQPRRQCVIVRRRHGASVKAPSSTRQEYASDSAKPCWGSWYDYFPWEDHRSGTPPVVLDVLRPA
ncbi:hypothetical protein D3227_28390 [Mesorhizobium waimense]|uniref:Uncharacterized protein n=1 Tax=Mesorhizobium waimense TaxID=1300307 RepID=A0A3A5K7J5_9HYPH|nr:hypothetical protein D3227_28390 [Mesorhizobium waimense]